MMKYLHIISVGSSIINNFERENPDAGLPRGGDDYAFKPLSTNRNLKHKIFQYLKQNPYSVSAELNSLKSYLENGQVNQVHLVLTKTHKCEIAGELLKRYFNDRNIRVSGTQKVSGYYRSARYNQKASLKDFKKGMLDLKNKLFRFIRRKQKEKNIKILINATGGFKAEAAVLVLVGALTKTPVYYKHEFFPDEIVFPQLLD
jgi:putative CRISPR-associated protein (TIGR02619 family)